jgi:PiT family inorganic phosphate transporter
MLVIASFCFWLSKGKENIVEIIAAYGFIFIIIAVVFGLYMTWGVGANDLANAMGASVGAGAVTVKQAICIAIVFEFLGAVLAGGHVTTTIRKGIVDPSAIINDPQILVYGMLASLLAAAVWLSVASAKGWPVSTTHSIVGAIVGFAIVGIGIDAVSWDKIIKVIASWIVSPLVGGTISFLLIMSIRKLILNTDTPLGNAKKYAPVYVFLVGFVISLVTLFKGLKHLKIDLSIGASLLVAVCIGGIVAFVGWLLIKRIKFDENTDRKYQFVSVEKVFTPLMLFTACSMAFAHGSNDVANGIGPLAAVFSIVDSGGEVMQKSPLPLWILLIGGGGIVLGLVTLGYRVMLTVGKKITELTPSSGFCAELAAATTVVLASRTGIPVSTTHILIGSIFGVGLARGVGALDLRVVLNIIISWLVTLPAGGFMAAFFFFTLKGIFG